MENFPMLPGYTFHDPSAGDHKLIHKFRFIYGYPMIFDSGFGPGAKPLDVESTAFAKNIMPPQYDPSLTYGRVGEFAYQQFIPHYALFAQKCLCFKAFFRQGVFNSPNEYFRIRHVNILYFLEDDTMTVMEPAVDNAGFQQGRLVSRGKIEKNLSGDKFSWKDLNVGIDVCIYGVVYHIIDCDLFTREFLSSQGIDVGDKEERPVDPYTESRESVKKVPAHTTQVADDSRRRFLEYDGMSLTFIASWNKEMYRIIYYLTDDTIAVYEILKPNSGKDPSALLLKKMKVPKDWKNLPSSYPSSYLEITDAEILEYYSPKDFVVGNTVFIFGRRFFLHNCDSFTRKYYTNMLGMTQPEEIPILKEETKPPAKVEIPPHLGIGSCEDSYQNCLSIVLKGAKKNVMRQLTNFPKKMRYSAEMDAVHPEDKDRNFIIEYNLSEGTLLVRELEKSNSGRKEGSFLKATLVPKPGSSRDNPEYYTPQDFFIGARINIFNHHFIVNGADLFVYRYIEANPEKFSQEVRDNIRNYFAKQNFLGNDIAEEVRKIGEKEDTAQRLYMPPEKDFKDGFHDCLNKVEVDAQRKYEGEHGELRPPTPPPEELCPGLITPNAKNDPSQPCGTQDKKKKLSWQDEAKK